MSPIEQASQPLAPHTISDTRFVLAKNRTGRPLGELEMVKTERVNGRAPVWRQVGVFQNAKVPNAKGPREQPHRSPRRHSHVVGLLYYTRWGLSNSCDGYCSRGWARPQGAESTENTRAKQPKKKK